MKYLGQKAIRRLFCWLLLATGVLSQFVLRAADFGFVQIWRSVRMVFGQDVAQPWPGMMAIARLSQVCGLVALLIGARRRDYLLVVGGMLVAAGNMYYYAALYLLPVFVLESRPTKGSCLIGF